VETLSNLTGESQYRACEISEAFVIGVEYHASIEATCRN